MSGTRFSLQTGLVQKTAGLVGTQRRAHNDDAAFARELYHFICRRFIADEYDTHHIHHAGGTDYLRVNQAGQQNALILHIGQNVAHHITAAGGVHFILEIFFTAKKLCTQERLDFKNFHERVRAD